MVEKIKAAEGIDDDYICRLKFPDPDDVGQKTPKIDARNIRVIFSLPKKMLNWKQETTNHQTMVQLRGYVYLRL